MTRAHDDRINISNQDYGYSIRVGDKVPPNAVNLAYVHTPEMAPRKNLLITDMSDKIVENNVTQASNSTMVYPDDTFLLRELNKPYYSLSKNLILTDEFSVPATSQQLPQPLYYKAEIKGLFNARGATVTTYVGGYIDRPITDGLDYSQLTSRDMMLYLGNKIRITRVDGSAIPSSYKYKIQLIKHSGVGIPDDAYRIVIYTNFRGDSKESYLIRYERYNLDGTQTSDNVEVLNAYPFFTEVSKSALDILQENPKDGSNWKPELQAKQYALQESGDYKWQVYAPSQVLIADNVVRPAQQFRYKIKGKLRARMDNNNPGEIYIGVVYFNETVFNAEDLTAVVKKTYEDGHKPPYLDFVNPHPPEGITKDSQSPLYWTVDLSMPADYLNDYDLIIITGYGSFNIDLYNDAIRGYLQNGGRVWIDNASTGSDVLKLTNFLTNIEFSTTQDSGGLKVYGIPDANLGQYDPYSLERRAIERLYVLNKSNIGIGYPNVNPRILFGYGESLSLWTKIVQYQSGDPAVIKRTIYDQGTLIVSNCGIFRSLSNRASDDIKFAINMILTMAEEKAINTPWIRDYVYHRDNLFREEYKNGDHDVYVDDKSDIDSTQIVAKKIINKSVRDALIPYVPSSYYRAKGVFNVEVDADALVLVRNSDYEVGSYDPVGGTALTSWNSSTANAIPGWSTQISTGTATFEHVGSLSQRGEKAVKITVPSAGSAYWYGDVGQVAAGTYRAAVWVKAIGVSPSGIKLSVHKNDGTSIASSAIITGDRDWTKIEVTFGVTNTTSLQLRIGFLEEGSGVMMADYVTLVNVGSVFMTPQSDGDKPLYAYSVRSKGDIFDLKSEGFTTADVTVYDPVISFYCTIHSFVYKWDNNLVKYIREYGNYSRVLAKARRSDGVINIGLLSTLAPGLKAGAEWANKDQVFFEVHVEPVEDSPSEFVNVAFFNTKNGRYFYSEAGEDVIGYSELYAPDAVASTYVQAWTDYYTIRATKRRYSIKTQDDERIYLEYPGTIDDRDAWHPRVHNGTFVKSGLSYYEYEEFNPFYQGRVFGTHVYQLPEYDRQLFKPGQPFRRVTKETCEYVNDLTVKVQSAPLYIKSGEARIETLTQLDTAKKIFKASNGSWLKVPAPKLYSDSNGNGTFLPYSGEYDIDYENGVVYLEDEAPGVVKADYDYKNISLFKRTYGNGKVKKEILKTEDKKVFYSEEATRSWLLYPNPVVFRVPSGETDLTKCIAPANTYEIDYDNGIVKFDEDVSETVMIDYMYSIDQELAVRDFDVQSGLIYLGSPITFKDEIYCNYYYEENFVEYRGYYDQELQQFVHLDLNPSEGHYCTMPVYRIDPATLNQTIIRYDNVPTAKLMNKEVYIYIVPHVNSFNHENQYTIRHCYSKIEWDKIRRTMPGIALLLGVVRLREHTEVTDAIVLDTRVRGGGLKESISKETMTMKDPLSTNFWDMGAWDGQAYYSNGVIIIQLPRSILKDNGGQFTQKEVDDTIKKYIAYGVYHMVEYV